MKLSQKRINQMTACIQLFLLGIMGVYTFEREIRIGKKVTQKLRKRYLKRRTKLEKRKGKTV